MRLYQYGANGMAALTKIQDASNLPAGNAWKYVREIEVNRGEGKRIIADSDEILDAIERDGFFQTSYSIKVSERV